ncbi:FHA domain-containing protein [Paeniglutamicibacter sp. MACA_103]|uniref:FHA domain-containing protein n=1 Tax=Paeniglutamicibacter sp. MACA_103 TaxID=3377337 RepID=UPI00389484CE
MNALRYLPGDWFALVSPQHVVLLPGDTTVTEVSSLWEQMDDAATVESLLTGILGAAQMRISSMPPFAIVTRDAAPHVVVRGQVSVASTNGSEQARGRDVATWLERRFAVADGWDVGVGADNDGHWLPIAEGIVRVSGLRHGADPEGAAAQAQAPDATAADAKSGTKSETQTGTATALTAAGATPASGTEPAAAPATGTELDASGPDAATEKAEAAEAADEGTASEANTEPAAESHDATEAATEGDTEETAGQPAEGNTDDEPVRGGDSVDLTQVSLASELLGRREDTFDGHVAPDASGGSAEPFEDDVDDSDTILTPRVPKPPLPYAAPAPAAAQAQGPGMIGAMPWMRKAATEPPPVPPKPAAPEALEAEDLDGNTILRSDLPAAKPANPADAKPSAEMPDAQPAAGLDEGLTLTGRNTTAGPREFVLARSCRNGHPNPPTAATCKKCGATLSGEAHQVPRPPLGKMIIADGPDGRETVHELTRSVVLGRQPSSHSLPVDLHPQLVQVQSPSGDISRNHLQVRIEGWHVELVDMGATNGSILLRAGNSPRRLARNEAVMLLDGDVADLGDGVSLRFEELP